MKLPERRGVFDARDVNVNMLLRCDTICNNTTRVMGTQVRPGVFQPEQPPGWRFDATQHYCPEHSQQLHPGRNPVN
jgi:hypothetical protein